MTDNAKHVRVLEEFLSEGGLYLANERAAFIAAIAAMKGQDARAAVEASQPSAAVTDAIPAGQLFALMMCSDPWPVDCMGEGTGQAEMVAFANSVARRMGFTDWMDAYHSTRQTAALSQGAASQPSSTVTDAMASLMKAAREITEDYPEGKDWRMESGRGYAVATGYVDDLRTALAALTAALNREQVK